MIRPAKRPLDGRFRASPSKSVTHRCLVAAALASGPSRIARPLQAEDTRITRDALGTLGFRVETGASGWEIHGRGGRVEGGADLFLGASGTSLRFLCAVAALGARPSRLDGTPRLRQRPIRDLADALGSLGGRVTLSPEGGLPLDAGGAGPRGGRVELAGGRSSQFASALLLIAPRLPVGLDLTLRPPVVSLPYVEVTAGVLGAFGVPVERPEQLRWRVGPADYPGREYAVEGDHSGASYLLAAAAIVGGRVRVEGLDPASAQPDARLPGILAGLGCTVLQGEDWIEVEGSGAIPPFDLDLSEAPDLVPTLAALALFSEGACVMRGIAHLRLKESDRLDVLAWNLSALGRPALARGGVLEVARPRRGSPLRGSMVRTAADHRIAMAFAVAGLRLEGVAVDDPGCVAKSDPRFWEKLEKLEGQDSAS